MRSEERDAPAPGASGSGRRLTDEEVDRLAQELLVAEDAGSSTALPSDRCGELSLDDAHRIQEAVTRMRCERGARVVGASVAAVEGPVEGADEGPGVVTGVLHSEAVHPAEQPLALAGLVAPTVTAGIVLRLGAELRGPGATPPDAYEAVTGVAGALAVRAGRYGTPDGKLVDAVADNLSMARLVLGPMIPPPEAERLDLLGMLFERGGELVSTAAGAAAPGGPMGAVASLANAWADRGRSLLPGWLVWTGDLVSAVDVRPGDAFRATFARLGDVGLRSTNDLETRDGGVE